MKIKFQKIGQVVKDGKLVSEQFNEIETETTKYCWLHPQIISHIENRKKPTEHDKKLLAKITLTSGKTVDRKGNVTFYRSCPKCHQFIKIQPRRLTATSIDTNIDENIVKEIAQGNKDSQIL